jgi:hypothetical protein
MPTAAALQADTYVYADIVKTVKNDDGTLTVYGIPANPETLDGDKQIADKGWLEKALTGWARYSNVREMHENSAVGVGVGDRPVEWNDGKPYVTADIVDPTAIKKVQKKVYKGFSIGVKGPVTRRDSKAPGGRIVGGDIIEISLVDRPCIPGSDILGFKADLFKIAGYVSDDEIVDYQLGLGWKSTPLNLEKRDMDAGLGGGVDRDKIPAADFAGPNRTYPIVTPKDVKDAAGLVGHADNPEQVKERIQQIARRKGAAFVAALPDSWTNDKENKVADQDTTEKTDGAATEKADVADLTKNEEIINQLAEKAAGITYCSQCGERKEIQSGQEMTLKGNVLLVGKCDHGHTLQKFVRADVEKADGSDDDGESDEDAEKGVIVVAPEHKPDEEKAADADAAKADGMDDGAAEMAADSDGEKTVDAPAATASKQVDLADGDIVKAALLSLLSDAGIDLGKVSRHVQQARAERLDALTDEFKELAAELGKADNGGPATVTGLDAATAGRMRDCLAEINELAGLMAAPSDNNLKAQPGSVPMGEAHVPPPSDRIDMQNYAAAPDLTKNSKTEENVEAPAALDAVELAKSIGAEVEKVLTPLRERLEEVEHSVKPASPPVFSVGERPSPFVGAQADAGHMALKNAMAEMTNLTDDDRAKIAAAVLKSSPGWPLAAG